MDEPVTGPPDEPIGKHASAQEPPIGALVHRLSEQIPELVRSEIRLAQAELAEKGKHAGIGVGMFSVAGLLAFFGVSPLIATADHRARAGAAGVVSALIVTVCCSLRPAWRPWSARSEVQQATPPAPEKTIAGVKRRRRHREGSHDGPATTARHRRRSRPTSRASARSWPRRSRSSRPSSTSSPVPGTGPR